MTAIPEGAQHASRTVGGVELAYLEWGDPGAPLALLLHGFPDAAPTWRHLGPRLAASGYHVVAPWLRGYAPSAVPVDGYFQPGALALDTCGLQEELGGGKPSVLVGHDWGAIAAYVAAASEPQRWRRVVTLAVPPLGDLMGGFLRYEQLHRSWYMFFFQHPLAEAAVGADDLVFIDRLWEAWSPGYDASADLPHVKEALRDPANLQAALGYYRAMLGDGPKDDALSAREGAAYLPLAVPTLYLHGANDGCMGAELVPDLSVGDHAPGSRSVVLPGCGHFLHLEVPEVVGDLVVDFLGS